jgi:hypothetical protein
METCLEVLASDAAMGDAWLMACTPESSRVKSGASGCCDPDLCGLEFRCGASSLAACTWVVWSTVGTDLFEEGGSAKDIFGARGSGSKA